MARLPWTVITPATEAVNDKLNSITFDGVNTLRTISAADRALAVPFITIWQVNRATNEHIGEEIASQFWTPPSFGEMTARFAERPSASLTSVSIKSSLPNGFILFREIEISIKVHRPDALFFSNALTSLLVPGNVHVLEYGWKGGQNALLSYGLTTSHKIPTDMGKEETINHVSTPASTSIRFAVTNYSFSITPDSQIEIAIKGVEDGELHIRQATLFDRDSAPKPKVLTNTEADAAAANAWLSEMISIITADIKSACHPFKIFTDKKEEGGKDEEHDEMAIQIKDIFEILFSEPLVKSMSSQGYGKVRLYLGVFNSNGPITVKGQGKQNLSSMPIGELWLLYTDVQHIIDDLVKTNGQITVYNLMTRLFSLFASPNFFENNGLQLRISPVSIPEMHIAPIFNPNAGMVDIYVIDRKRYLSKILAAKDSMEYNEHTLHNKDKPKFIKESLASNQLAYMEFSEIGAFIQDAKFNVTQDELMQSIFMKKNMDLNRHEITSGNQTELTVGKGLIDASVLYRSAIAGEITMMGNFAFNPIGIFWFDFGVSAWNGFFYVISRTDKIENGSFTTSITVQAEGSNPLGKKDSRPLDAASIAQSMVQKIAIPPLSSIK